MGRVYTSVGCIYMKNLLKVIHLELLPKLVLQSEQSILYATNLLCHSIHSFLRASFSICDSRPTYLTEIADKDNDLWDRNDSIIV